MRGKFVIIGLAIALSGVAVNAQDQTKVTTPIPNDLYCSGVYTNHAPPRDTFIITGEESESKVTFQEGNYIYLNKGESQGVHVGDMFSVVRAVDDPTREPWFDQQFKLMHAIGTLWQDEGHVKVVVVHPNTSVAQIGRSCEYLQRGDIAVPFVERVAPPLKPTTNFDRFAPPSGKAKAMLVTGKYFQSSYGTNDIVYVNLGEAQGVHVGDYFRVFRYQGQENEIAFQTKRMAFEVYGYGGVSKSYKWDTVPREVLGEGIVVRTSPDSSSVLITSALKPLYAGQYVEIE
jgi:hypothetical protein